MTQDLVHLTLPTPYHEKSATEAFNRRIRVALITDELAHDSCQMEDVVS